MTLPFPFVATCGVCGSTSKQCSLVSTNTMGYPDLDLRPAEMKRSTMNMWLCRCPECGYCATDIANASDAEKETVRSDDYQSRLNDPTFPDLANTFRCRAMLHHRLGEFAQAAHAMLSAAWVCDDYNMTDAAVTCRLQAAEFFESEMESGRQARPDNDTDIAILVDLYRRAGKLDQARMVAEQYRNSVRDENVKRVLDFELILIGRGDTGCHSAGEVFDSED